MAPSHQTDDVRNALAPRDKVDDRNRAFLGFEIGLQDQSVAAIAARDACLFLYRGNQPAAVVRSSEQCRKARGAVKTRQSQPVDRAVASDQRDGLAIAD